MPLNALVGPRVGRVRSPSRSALTWPRVYSLSQGSPTHWLLVEEVLFTKMRGRKANVRRSNRVSGHGEFT
ncbi:unnamed protein product [Schistosoma curassoni]|uniref:Uncharacterized protein n=1 Tax=Schistosoma curassoni TaxID=6186 RepID=A0A183K2P4_9TREM|nr:unnamed protein product [Schistosoma curassoni]